ncbi:MAG: S8 family serine peptidase [Roseiflexaceae bacterium]
MAAIERTTAYATLQGTLVVAIAGNAAMNFDQARDLVVVPAELTTVMAVSATGPVGAIGVEPDTSARYTNYGSSLVDVAAPGGGTNRYPVGDWRAIMRLLVEKGRMGRNAAIATQAQPLYDAEYEAKLGW